MIYEYFREKRLLFHDFVLQRKQWIMFSVTELTIFLLVMIFIYVMPDTSINTRMLMIINCLLCFMFALTFYYHASLITSSAKLVDEKAKRLSMEYNKDFYENMHEIYEKNKAVSHDLKRHIQLIDKMIQDAKYNEALSYLDTVKKDIHNKNRLETKREVLNYIVDLFLQKAEETQIRCIVGINHTLDFIDDVGICILLGNLLDNCIDAQRYVSKHRHVSLHIKVIDDAVVIKVANSYEPNAIVKKGMRFISNKDQSGNHGYGMKNIEEIVNKYQGTMEITEGDDFQVIIYFPDRA